MRELGIKDEVASNALFNFFDTDKTGSIDFHEVCHVLLACDAQFAVAITIFTHGSAADKANFMQVICDRQQTGTITKTDLRDT